MAQVVSLGVDGYFRRGGEPFFPVGVNYRPAGCEPAEEWWRSWPAEKIRADIAAIAGSGLNAVRVSCPATDGSMERVRDFVAWCAGRGVAVVFVGANSFVAEGALDLQRCQPVVFSARPDSHLLGFDGLTDPFFHSLLPFAVGLARAAGPTVVTSIGVGASLSPGAETIWLEAALPAARRAGAAGFFWSEWCGEDGLCNADGSMHAGREVYCAFARDGGLGHAADAKGSVALWVPCPSEAEGECLRRLAIAQYFLGCIGYRWRAIDPGQLRTLTENHLLIAGVPVSREDVVALHDWTATGGRLYWHGPDPLRWSDGLARLLGARPIDWRSGRGISMQAFGERFTLAHFPHHTRAELQTGSAEVVAADHQGHPTLLENHVGNGRVRYALPLVEDAIVPVAAHPAARDRWAAWYRGMFA